ncbi:bifunctional methylenetetrahydrofolate dehydrogenase/methenyltetrahydrofolate cyclohydrolase, partial [Francisella tularensis subsp. holarctica]|nr:bifunctional methylenetetrahydrofolate dehydrogenase/methenyltetrahydrofolate cyclohydrolase [Francisella tularensis subsp. holarctica]
TEGAYVVVVVSSYVVGKRVSQLMLYCKASVKSCHRFTSDLISHSTIADILIVAFGKRIFI